MYLGPFSYNAVLLYIHRWFTHQREWNFQDIPIDVKPPTSVIEGELPGIHDEQVESFTYCKFIFGSAIFFFIFMKFFMRYAG